MNKLTMLCIREIILQHKGKHHNGLIKSSVDTQRLKYKPYESEHIMLTPTVQFPSVSTSTPFSAEYAYYGKFTFLVF